MMNSETERGSAYQHIVEDVINKSSQVFIRHCGDDSLLALLQANWELKMKMRRVLPGWVETNFSVDHDSDLPYPDLFKAYCCSTKEELFSWVDTESVCDKRVKKDEQVPFMKPSKRAVYVNQPCRPWLKSDHNLAGSQKMGRETSAHTWTKEPFKAPKMGHGQVSKTIPQKRNWHQSRVIPQLDVSGDTISCLEDSLPIVQKVSSSEDSSSEGNVDQTCAEEQNLVQIKSTEKDTCVEITGASTPSYSDFFPDEEDGLSLDDIDDKSDELDALHTKGLVLTKYNKAQGHSTLIEAIKKVDTIQA